MFGLHGKDILRLGNLRLGAQTRRCSQFRTRGRTNFLRGVGVLHGAISGVVSAGWPSRSCRADAGAGDHAADPSPCPEGSLP